MRSINSSVVKKLLPRLKSHAFLLALAMLSAVVSISLTLLIPVLVGNAIDNIIGEGQVYFEAVKSASPSRSSALQPASGL